jgi:hypothetical protein
MKRIPINLLFLSINLMICTALILLLGGQQYDFASEIGVKDVMWTPEEIKITAYPGTSHSLTVELKNRIVISNVSLFVSPEISRFFSIGPFGPSTMPAGISVNLPAVVEIPASAPLGTYEGTVHLRSGRRTIPRTLKVVVNVIAPSDLVAPGVVANPSPDRVIIDELGQKMLKDEIVVGLDFDTPNPSEVISNIAASTGGVILGSVAETLSYQLQYKVPDLVSLESIRLLLESLEYVAFASHHFLADPPSVIPNDTEYDEDHDGNYNEHWDVNTPAGNNWNLEFIDAPGAWDNNTGSSNVSVAVIDSGFYREHEDLNDNIAYLNGSSSNSGGHGTDVAGIICAEGNNGLGVTGVSWDCSLRLYDYNSGTAGTTALRAQEQMVRAANDAARIVNMSLQWIDNNQCGTPGTANTLTRVAENNAILGRAILYAERNNLDVLWIFAAGNECRDSKYASPASLTYNFPLNTIAVAAVDTNGGLAWFSNFGDLVTVAAPGVDILSTFGRSCPIPLIPLWCSDTYESMDGTSMAAPHVSGLASLVLSEHTDFSASKIKNCILSAAQRNGRSVSGHSFKVIDALEAVKCEGVVDLPAKVDIVFSIDLTGSMYAEISRIKQEIGTIIEELSTVVSPSTDFRFGLVSYEDYPGYFDSRVCGSYYYNWYGNAGSKPNGDAAFRIDQPLTNDIGAVRASVLGLEQGDGADGPQSYGRVFWELGQEDTGANLGFRSDALKVIVNFGDSIPHDRDLNEGISSPPFPTLDTGVDPGRNGVIDCNSDDIDFQDDALVALSSKGIRLLHIDSSGYPSFYPYWQFWTSETGGAFAAINSDGSIPGGLDLTDLIIDLLGLIQY